MAFYFRKFRESLRLVPATKSLGHSTLVNQGDKTKENGACSPKQKYATTNCVHGRGEPVDLSTSLIAASASASSALVPLSVRDMAVVLLPRLEGSNRRPLNNLEPFMDVAKAVSFTCDDILVESSNSRTHSPHTKTSSLERVVINMRQSNTDCNRNRSKLGADKFHQHVFASPQWETGETERHIYSDKGCASGNFFETLLMSDKQCPSFDGFLSMSGGVEDRKGKSPPKDGPSSEQLHSMKENLEGLVSQMFGRRYNYSLLHQNVIFENNLFGDNRLRRGPTAYALELLNLRFKIHTRFSSTAMEVLNTTVNEDSGVVRIHWRLKGLPQTEVLKFWRMFQTREEINKDDWQWFEAFSYFHIGKDGKVHKHRIDRMLPGSEEPDKLSNKLRKLLNPAKPLVN